MRGSCPSSPISTLGDDDQPVVFVRDPLGQLTLGSRKALRVLLFRDELKRRDVAAPDSLQGSIAVDRALSAMLHDPDRGETGLPELLLETRRRREASKVDL